jgi:RNA polymerase sigma-70 factor (ECF subfamily)
MTDWDAIVTQFGRTVFGIAYRILGSIHEAEDVSQEVFAAAFEFEKRQPVRQWAGFLRQLATTRSIDRLRRTRRTVPLEESMVAGRNEPVAELAATKLAERLRLAIGRLPPQQAAVFTLAFFEGLSRNEIATSLAISVEAVSTAMYKSRQKLSSQFSDVSEEVQDA